MKKNIIFAIVFLTTITFCACNSTPPQINLWEEELITLRQSVKAKEDSLNMYRKLPFLYAKNPLNKADSILVTNTQSWVTFDSSLKQIQKYADELLAERLKKIYNSQYFLKSQIISDKKEEIVQKFKKNNKAFCERWASYLLDEELELDTDNTEEFNENPAYIKMYDQVLALYQEDSGFIKARNEVQEIKNADLIKIWENFKAAN